MKKKLCIQKFEYIAMTLKYPKGEALSSLCFYKVHYIKRNGIILNCNIGTP